MREHVTQLLCRIELAPQLDPAELEPKSPKIFHESHPAPEGAVGGGSSRVVLTPTTPAHGVKYRATRPALVALARSSSIATATCVHPACRLRQQRPSPPAIRLRVSAAMTPALRVWQEVQTLPRPALGDWLANHESPRSFSRAFLLGKSSTFLCNRYKDGGHHTIKTEQNGRFLPFSARPFMNAM